MTLRDEILEISRQNQIGPLSPWFSAKLDEMIKPKFFSDAETLHKIKDDIIINLTDYRLETRVETVVLGMSGGVDSALTAALFKAAGWKVIGYTLPIHQNPEETQRGIEACEALGIEHRNVDLTLLYDTALGNVGGDREYLRATYADNLLTPEEQKKVKIRRGNIRARLRMITLYNAASLEGGIVASTDNLSELGAGFWTLHGDVGDVSPIQSLLKSWEVPYLARLMGVPEATILATPTDGLGIDAGDEAQLGCSYLEWDIMMFEITKMGNGVSPQHFGSDPRATQVCETVLTRMGSSWFKRMNPVNIPHPLDDRFAMIEDIDDGWHRPMSVLRMLGR